MSPTCFNLFRCISLFRQQNTVTESDDNNNRVAVAWFLSAVACAVSVSAPTDKVSDATALTDTVPRLHKIEKKEKEKKKIEEKKAYIQLEK